MVAGCAWSGDNSVSLESQEDVSQIFKQLKVNAESMNCMKYPHTFHCPSINSPYNKTAK